MADGLNREFTRSPAVFLQTHTLMVNPQQVGSYVIPAGLTNIDLVKADHHVRPPLVRLEDYNSRAHTSRAAPIPAYYCPAIVDNWSAQALGAAATYAFTPDLSGCLFAAYGANAANVTIEHVNVRTGAAPPNLFATRAAAAMAFAWYRIITPQPLGVMNANIVLYHSGANVVGVRTAAGWTFVYRLDANPVAQF